MNPHRWLHEHSLKLLAIRDTPEAIAGGVAIGIFFGFTPLFGLKTVLSILFAWLTRSNIIAAVIASAAHDVLLPLMPVVFRWEYDVGFWLLSQPHQWPQPLTRMPAAKPRRFEANQAEANAIMGTFEPALPAPVRLRIKRANSKEFDNPVRMRPMATTAREIEMITREPIRVAQYPPSNEKAK